MLFHSSSAAWKYLTKKIDLKMEASLLLFQKFRVSLKVGCLPYAVGKQPSIPLINPGTIWTLTG